MESIQDTAELESPQTAKPGRVRLIVGQFNWRMMLVRVLVNSLTLIVVALVLPDIYFPDKRLLNLLFLAAMLGLLNAFVKPIIQFLTLPFIFATYGFVIVAINTIMLILLAAIFPNRFAVDRLIWAIVGGALMGLLASILESLFGLNLPIVSESDRPDGQGVRPVPRPSPVESLLFEGVAGHKEANLASEDEVGTAPVEVPAVPEPAVADPEETAPAEAKAASGPESGDTPGETNSDNRPTQPGDEQ